MTDQIPDIVLERYRLHELPPADTSAIADRLQRDAVLRTRLRELDASDARLQADVERVVRHVAARPRPGGSRAVAWAIPVAVATVAITIAVVVRPRIVVEPSPVDRIKGAEETAHPSLALYRRTVDGSERLADGAVARPGDVIRVGYRPAGRAYGAIVSIDGRGTVTVHLPGHGATAVPLRADATVLLDQSYELDDAPKWERFYFVAGASPFDVGVVVKAAQEAPARLTLPRGLDQSTFTLQKESGR
jgi:hypothetical protein